MTQRKVLLVSIIALTCIILFIAYRYDPMSGTFPFPRCWVKLLTGFDCPGCGSTRALHAMLHGHISEAIDANPAVFFAIPLFVLCLIAENSRYFGLRRILFSKTTITIIIAITILWTVMRNIYL